MATPIFRPTPTLLQTVEMISKNGIFFLPGKLGAFCTAHSQSDLKNLVNASSNFAAGL